MLPDPMHGSEAGTPQDWLRYARSDLALAQLGTEMTNVLLETLCYHAQQAAEKSFKAVLLHHNVAFPFTHDLARLLTSLQEAGIQPPETLQRAVELTVYSVAGRYPTPDEEITVDEYHDAVSLADAVVDWAQTHISA